MTAEKISSLAVPAVILLFCFCLVRGRNSAYESFMKGAKDGLKTSLSVFPVKCFILIDTLQFHFKTYLDRENQYT